MRRCAANSAARSINWRSMAAWAAPNRDGTCGTRGCIFCSEQGSGDFAAPHCADLAAQLSQAKARVARKAPDARYIAYFQSFTNTYAPTAYLEALFSAAMAPPEIVALSVATRPDCLPPETVALLARLNRRQARLGRAGPADGFDETARHIRRGYALPVFADAVARLKAAGLTVIVHQILGLPGETTAQMRQTTAYIAHAGVGGIKLQLLHVLEGTDLAADWRAGRVPVLTLEKYIQLLCDCVRLLPPEMVIHRLTGDGPKRLLLAPQWSGDKKRVLNAIRQEFIRQDVCQGQWYRG